MDGIDVTVLDVPEHKGPTYHLLIPLPGGVGSLEMARCLDRLSVVSLISSLLESDAGALRLLTLEVRHHA